MIYGGDVSEEYAIVLTGDDIQQGRKHGFDIKVYGQQRNHSFTLPAWYVNGFFDKIAETQAR